MFCGDCLQNRDQLYFLYAASRRIFRSQKVNSEFLQQKRIFINYRISVAVPNTALKRGPQAHGEVQQQSSDMSRADPFTSPSEHCDCSSQSLLSLVIAELQQEEYTWHISFDLACSGWKTKQDYAPASMYTIPCFPSLEFSWTWCSRLASDNNRQPQVCIYNIFGQWIYVMSALKIKILYKLNHKQLKSLTNLT